LNLRVLFDRALFRVTIDGHDLPSMGYDKDITQWMNTAGAYPLLAHGETEEIFRAMKNHAVDSCQYQALVNKIVQHNLRLVVNFVSSFIRNKTCFDWQSSETIDYLQVGVLGLIDAAKKFDPDRGYKFSTYAMHWIRHHVGRYNIKSSSLFNIPEEACRIAYRVSSGKPVYDNSDTPEKDLAKGRQIAFLVRAAQAARSWEEIIGEGMTLDQVFNQHCEPERRQELGSFEEEIEEVIDAAGLTAIEDEIIRDSYLSSCRPGATAERLGISVARVIHVRNKALKKLRRHCHRGMLVE
jgi:RNA polymerase sigma factor (sigma-70 family)